jgi:AcrR family transcriptional regulator
LSPRVDPEERRNEIIQAATRCFARSGYHRTSMDDIVAESGLSKGTLYWHFKNKQALFLAMLEALFTDMTRGLEQVIAAEGTVSERLTAIARLFWKMFTDEKELGDLMIEFWGESNRDKAINEYFMGIFQSYIAVMTGLIEEGIASGEFRPVPAKAVASTFGAAMDGLWLQAMIGIPVEDYVDPDELVDWMLKGLLPR